MLYVRGVRPLVRMPLVLLSHPKSTGIQHLQFVALLGTAHLLRLILIPAIFFTKPSNVPYFSKIKRRSKHRKVFIYLLLILCVFKCLYVLVYVHPPATTLCQIKLKTDKLLCRLELRKQQQQK